MSGRPIKIKLFSAFVIAFICLNAGGAACVAYCQSMGVSVTAGQAHCPLKKAGADCDRSTGAKDRNSVGQPSGELDCCPMTVSFFAAPVEKNSNPYSEPTVAAVVTPKTRHVEFRSNDSYPATANYRGPPPLDRRSLRIQHCILRI